MDYKILRYAVCVILCCFLVKNVASQATYHFNPTSPPVYPDGTIADGTMIKPYPMYAQGAIFINMLTAGAPISELNLKFKASLAHPIVGAVPLTAMPKILSFTPWDMAPSPTMTTTLMLIGPFPINASSLVMENVKFTFNPGSKFILSDVLKSKNVLLTIKNSEITYAAPGDFFIKMRSPNMVTIENVKMTRAFPADIPHYFTFFHIAVSTTDISVKNLKFTGAPNPSADISKNNLMQFNCPFDSKAIEVLNSDISFVNLMAFNHANGSFISKKNIIVNTKFTNAGLFNYLKVQKGNIEIDDISFKKVKIISSRLIEIISPTNKAQFKKINMNEMEFVTGDGNGNQLLPRFLLTLNSIGELYVENWYFNKVISKYPDKKAPNCLIHIAKPVISFTVFDVKIPDNFEVNSYISTYDKITNLKVEMVKSEFSKGYHDKWAGSAKSSSPERRYNLITVYGGVQNAIFSNISAIKNVITKSSFILVFNAIDIIKFTDIFAEDNLVSCDVDQKCSLMTVLQTKTKVNKIEVINSKFTRNYFANGKSFKNFSSCFTFNGKIADTLVQNTEFFNNRAPDKQFDIFDITSLVTSLMEVNIVSSIDIELKEKISGITGNGGGFCIFGKTININKSKILCTAKSPNLKGKKRNYALTKDCEQLMYLDVEDFYKFKC